MPFPGLVYLVYFVIYAGLWLGGLVLLLAGYRLKKSWLKIVGSIFLFAALAITALYFRNEHRDHSPSYVYETAFNEAPTAKVNLVSGKLSESPDSAGLELRFKTDQDTFYRLRREFQTAYKVDLSHVSLAQYRTKGGSPGEFIDLESLTPETEIYTTDNWPSSNYAEVTYDPKSGLVQLHWMAF